MHTLLKTKIGPFLVISSVLALWTLLAAQHIQAHGVTNPSCSGLPTTEGFLTDSTIDLASNARTITTKPGTGSPSGNTNYHYAKITAPALTAGELTVSTTTAPSEAILCGRQEGNVTSQPSYATAHTNAESAARTATTAETAAQAAVDNTNINESQARSALRNAASALRSAAGALRSVATALRNADNSTDAGTADAAADAAYDTDSDTDAHDDALVAAGTTVDTRTGEPTNNLPDDEITALRAAVTALGEAAGALEMAAIDLDPHMGFRINTLISSGDEEYVVVVTALEGETPSLNVTFEGVMSTVATALDGGSFTQPNQRITHSLMTTQNAPGLLTVKTTGSAVDTVGTLDTDNNDSNGVIVKDEDEDGDGNFEIVSPVKANTTHYIQVDGQTRNEMGDYGLKVEFRVATNLGQDAYQGTITTANNFDREDLAITHGADYFFFTAPEDQNNAGYRFLTVQTQKHDDVTTATNTTGTLFSDKGVVNTDTDSGFGTNFLIRAPISPGDYIVEVKGSTGGKYALSVTSEAATPHTTPTTDEIAGSATGTLAARDVKPHSINVAKPGSLQVKTTGGLDTIGVLYGPDGQQIVEDDNSGPDMNFRITQAVEAGQYIVTVEGKAADTAGNYTLVVNFLEDVDLGSEGRIAELQTERDTARTERDTARTERDDLETERDTLQTQVTRLEDEAAPVEVDATGNLGNPSGVRSGVGLISGWVCAANSVQIRISNAQGRVETLNAAYGTTRADTVDACDHQEDTTGFGMTYNFNHLPEGTYTIGAYADGLTNRRIGPERTFEVVHLVEFAAIDDDRFLRGLDGMCSVPDFPAAGDTTMLEWEQSIQNFVVSDVQ